MIEGGNNVQVNQERMSRGAYHRKLTHVRSVRFDEDSIKLLDQALASGKGRNYSDIIRKAIKKCYGDGVYY